MANYDFDIGVIGGGAGGLTVTAGAAQLGAKTILIEKEKELGLNPDELAFYDALANNESAVRELGDETLKKIANELTDKLRKSTTVDWQVRESVRARLRNLVRIVLRRYKYPPDQQKAAIELVLRQAEVLSDGWSAAP